jgi:hypothetical protein
LEIYHALWLRKSVVLTDRSLCFVSYLGYDDVASSTDDTMKLVLLFELYQDYAETAHSFAKSGRGSQVLWFMKVRDQRMRSADGGNLGDVAQVIDIEIT